MYKAALTKVSPEEVVPLAYAESNTLTGLLVAIENVAGITPNRSQVAAMLTAAVAQAQAGDGASIAASLVNSWPGSDTITAIDPAKGLIKFDWGERPSCGSVVTRSDLHGKLTGNFYQSATCTPAFPVGTPSAKVDTANGDGFPVGVRLYKNGRLHGVEIANTPWEIIAGANWLLGERLYAGHAAILLYHGAILTDAAEIVVVGDPQRLTVFGEDDDVPLTPFGKYVSVGAHKHLQEAGIAPQGE